MRQIHASSLSKASGNSAPITASSGSDDTTSDDCDVWPPQPDTASASVMKEMLGDLGGLILDRTGGIDESQHLCRSQLTVKFPLGCLKKMLESGVAKLVASTL